MRQNIFGTMYLVEGIQDICHILSLFFQGTLYILCFTRKLQYIHSRVYSLLGAYTFCLEHIPSVFFRLHHCWDNFGKKIVDLSPPPMPKLEQVLLHVLFELPIYVCNNLIDSIESRCIQVRGEICCKYKRKGKLMSCHF